jgi:hypothetical protein
MTDLGKQRANGAGDSGNVVELPANRRGRPKGSKNRRTVLGRDFMNSLKPAAKKRLREILQGKDDELAMKAAELTLAYVYGKPVQTREIGGLDGEPLNGGELLSPLELARAIAFALERGVRAAGEPADAPQAPEPPKALPSPILDTALSQAPADGPPFNVYDLPAGQPPAPKPGHRVCFMDGWHIVNTGTADQPTFEARKDHEICRKGAWQWCLALVERKAGLEGWHQQGPAQARQHYFAAEQSSARPRPSVQTKRG